MDARSLEYFSTLNPLAKKVVNDNRLVEKLLSDRWDSFTLNEQEDIIDDFFVSPSVRRKYDGRKRENEYSKSFPKLTIQSGEKIVIDNDFWTWQDGHSAPFSWRSKSQEELRLIDLEPEELSKTSSKFNKSKKTSDEQQIKEQPISKQQFPYKPNESLWNDVFPTKLKELSTEDLLLQKDTNHIASTVKESQEISEEINYGFQDIESKNIQNGHADQQRNGEVHEAGEVQKGKSKSSKSPVKTSKLALSSSFSKKKKDENEILVTKKDETMKKSKSNSSVCSKDFEEAELHANVFDNPLMSGNVAVTHLSQDEEESSSSASSPSRRPLLKEPMKQTMDRDDRIAMEIDFTESSTDTYSLLHNNDGFEEAELKVTEANKSEDLNNSSIPMTGFDFLDQW